MSNIDGLLINNNNIYGLVNPPPAPTSGDKAKGHQDISSAAVRWDSFVDLSSTVVDLSNSQLNVIQASPYFNSIIDRVPYNTVYGTSLTFYYIHCINKDKLFLHKIKPLQKCVYILRVEMVK